MLKINRTESAKTIIDECIFRVFHNQNTWECDSFTTKEQEDTVQRIMNYGIFPKFVKNILSQETIDAIFLNLQKNNLGYGDIMEKMREMFYDYQEICSELPEEFSLSLSFNNN